MACRYDCCKFTSMLFIVALNMLIGCVFAPLFESTLLHEHDLQEEQTSPPSKHIHQFVKFKKQTKKKKWDCIWRYHVDYTARPGGDVTGAAVTLCLCLGLTLPGPLCI